MKRILLILGLFVLLIPSYAQSLEGHLTGGEDSASKNAISIFRPTPEVQGFRVCIFSGSEQDARTKAKQNLELCYTQYPDMTGEIKYEAPIFKVIVGVCATRIEAIQLLSKLKPSFPKAFIMSCSIPIQEFVSESEQADTTAM